MRAEQEIYEKFCNGDRLSDDDLNVGYIHFLSLETLLRRSGPAFSLAAKEAGRVASALNEFKESRNRVNG